MSRTEPLVGTDTMMAQHDTPEHPRASPAPEVPSQRSLWTARGLAAGFLGLGILLRVYNFWGPELWLDEYGTWWALAGGGWSEVWERVIAIGTQSPFYYFIVKLSTDPLGIGPLSLRLPSILAGVVTLALAYPLGMRIFENRHASLLALAAFSVNYQLIWYSQEARPYSLVLCLVMLSFFFYLSLLKTGRAYHSIGYVLATAGVYYAHYIFAFIVVVQILHLFSTRGRSWLVSNQWRITFLLLFLLCLPGLPQVASLFGRRESLDWIPPRDWAAALEQMIQFLDPQVFSVTALAVLAAGLAPMREPAFAANRHLLLAWFLIPLAAFAVIPPLFGVTLLFTRYVLFVAPASVFIVAWLMASGRRTGWRKWLPLGVFLVTTFLFHLIPPLETSGTFSNRPHQGWTSAAAVLEQSGSAGDAVLLHSGFVENEVLAESDPNPYMISGMRWPLTVNLPPDHPYRILDLPSRVNNRMQRYLSYVLGEAGKHRRIWVIGVGSETISYVVRHLINYAGFQLKRELRYGGVAVLVLERNSGESLHLPSAP